MNLNIPYTLIGVSRGAVQKVGDLLESAGSSGKTMAQIVNETGLSKSVVENALTALRRKCKAPIYTIGGSGSPVYVWEELKIATLEDFNG